MSVLLGVIQAPTAFGRSSSEKLLVMVERVAGMTSALALAVAWFTRRPRVPVVTAAEGAGRLLDGRLWSDPSLARVADHLAGADVIYCLGGVQGVTSVTRNSRRTESACGAEQRTRHERSRRCRDALRADVRGRHPRR